MRTVEIRDGKLLIDGKAQQIISGSMHYFRVHPAQWDDRLDKAVALGLNTLETYIPWNLHEPHPGEYNFSGICDLEAFIDKVQAHGLNMILRPGPYICAEWDNGGFPGWLLAVPGVQLRRMNEPYLNAVRRYYKVLLPKLRAKLYTNGGPIIMLQLENEYGSFSHDKDYLHAIYDLYREEKIDVPFFTSDGAGEFYIEGGTIPEALMTLNFGSHSDDAWKIGRRFRPNGVDFCMEFWNGWFDHWGEKHHTRSADEGEESAAAELERMLRHKANVNLYMFHGGTNFGFTNGANGNLPGEYQPTVTSYDYDCPVNECGDANDKFYACQKVIARYSDNPRIAAVKESVKIQPKPVELTGSAALLDNVALLAAASGHAVTPPTMEQLGENFGFVHYRKHLDGPLPAGVPLRLVEVNDYAQVWLDGKYLGSRLRSNGQDPIILPAIGDNGAQLDVLVENCGRINYGPMVGRDFKGIVGCVTVELQMQLNWDYAALPLNDLSALKFGAFSNAPGMFHRGEFTLETTGDAFLRFPGEKGDVWINGFHLGRYWSKGPTEAFYVPAPVLKCGVNEVIVLEQEKLTSKTLTFAPGLCLGSSK